MNRSSIAQYLGADHDRCDALFFQAEASVGKGQWAQAELTFREFNAALYRHLMLEEEVMFPALREALPGACGPTDVMRMEHRQMRKIVKDMDEAVSAHNAEEFLGNSETLNIMMQQHNFKEENMLYAMADQALASRRAEIIAAMDELRIDPAFDHVLLSDVTG